MRPTRKIAFGAIALVLALLVGYSIVEIGFRAYLYATNEIDPKFPGVAILDHPLPTRAYLRMPGHVFGPYIPSTTYSMAHYSVDNRPINPHRFHTNNLAWVSHYDYAVKKPDDEFRVAVIGASLVASTTNEYPWVDALQRYLNGDEELRRVLGVRRITAMNFGLGGFQSMVDPGLAIARRFSPDFIILNFATSNVLYPENAQIPELKDEPVPVSATLRSYPGEVKAFVVGGVAITLTCPYGVTPSIDHPKCIADLRWSITPGRQLDPTEFAAIKQRVAETILRRRVILSPFPIAAYHLLGYPVFPQQYSATPKVDGQSVALKVFHAVRQVYPHAMFAHNPLEPDLGGNPEWGDIVAKLVAAAQEQGAGIVRMSDYLPVQLGKNEWEKWYIKDNGHWSDYGSEVYGRAMYLALRNRLVATVGFERVSRPLRQD